MTTPTHLAIGATTSQLMERIAEATRERLAERADTERYVMDHDREEQWQNPEAQREWIEMLGTATVTASDHEVTVIATGPAIAVHTYSLAECLDGAVGNVVAGEPLGEITEPAPGVAVYHHRDPEQVEAEAAEEAALADQARHEVALAEQG